MPQSNIFDPARLVLSQPTCPKCWATMCLTHIEPDEPDYDKRNSCAIHRANGDGHSPAAQEDDTTLER